MAKFSNPTAAEAILAAMDRDLAQHDAEARHATEASLRARNIDPTSADIDARRAIEDILALMLGRQDGPERRQIEDDYLGSVAELGDKRIVGELARRYRATDIVRMRRKYVAVSCDLGDMGLLKDLAHDLEKGSLALPPASWPSSGGRESPAIDELTGVLMLLARAEPADRDRALYALTAPKHPYHAVVAQRVLKADIPSSKEDEAWLGHPFCLTILRESLDDTSPTGATWKIEAECVVRDGEHKYYRMLIPDYLADPAARREQAPERRCDETAVKLGKILFGPPPYNPLLKNADTRLAATKKLLDRFQGHFRGLTQAEARSLGMAQLHPVFAPDITPLDHAAMAEDVAKGRAVFHLDGKGKLAGVKLPAVATLRQPKLGKHPPLVLVVQAEVGPDGRTTYGIIGDGDVRAAAAEELTTVEPIADDTSGTK